MARKTEVYRNSDWKVFSTAEMHCTIRGERHYWLDVEAVRHRDWDGDWYYAPVHMAGKRWLDVPRFLDAWCVAIGIAVPDADPARVARSCERAWLKVISGIRYRAALMWQDVDRGEFPVGPRDEALTFRAISLAEMDAIDDAHPWRTEAA